MQRCSALHVVVGACVTIVRHFAFDEVPSSRSWVMSAVAPGNLSGRLVLGGSMKGENFTEVSAAEIMC